MKILKIIPFAFVTITGVLIACNKEAINQKTINQSLNASQISNLALSTCDQFAYPDSVFYLKPQASKYIVKPLTPLAGTYGAFPAGLQINTANGSINVNKSETGLEYIVWFVANGTTDTCKKFITISGVNYNDSIYVMANNSALAQPVYNADTLIPVACNGCEFDDGPDDDNGNGSADEPPAGQELIPQGFVIDKTTGIINFKESIQNGVLGKNPLSGTSKQFTLNYRLGDKSSMTLNHISFELFYYNSQSEIPAKLKKELSAKQSQILLENEDEGNDDGGHHGGGHNSDNFASVNLAEGSGTTAKHGKAETKCRPPYIIVTQQ